MLIRGGASSYGKVIPRNTGLVGNSITANPGMSSFWWINALNGGPLRLVKNAGVGSQRVTHMLARIDNLYTDSNPGLAGFPEPLGWVFVRAGTNNGALDQSLSSVEGGLTLAQQYEQLTAKILTYADRCVWFQVPPLGSGTFTRPREYSEFLASLCAANPARLTFVDDCAGVRISADVQDSTKFSDFVHPNQWGTRLMGQAGAANAELTEWFDRYSPLPLVTDPADVYPATSQWVPNPTMAGTGGSLGTGITGVAPDGWSIARSAGLATAVSSIVAADGGDENQGPWWRITPTGAGGSGFDITTTLNGRAITTTDPAQVEVAVQLRFNGLNTLAAADFYQEVKHSDSGLLAPRSYLLCSNSGTLTVASAVLRSFIPRDNASSHADAIYRLHCGSESGSGGSFDLRSVSARG